MSVIQKTEEHLLRRSKLWFMILAILLLSLSQCALSLVAVMRFEARLLPEILQKAELVGTEVSSRITNALAFDHNLNALRAAEPYFDKVLELHPEIIALTIVTTAGKVVTTRSSSHPIIKSENKNEPGKPEIILPILADFIKIRQAPVGTLQITINHNYAEKTLREMTYDVLTVLAISLLITFGLASFVIQARFSGRIDAVLTMLERLGKGDLRPNKIENSADRIGDIFGSLNALVKRVRDLYQESLVRLESYGPSATMSLQLLTVIGERNRLTDPPVDDTPPATRLLALRLVTFVFFLAEEVIRPFLPLYVKQLAGDLANTPSLIGLPFSLFIFVGAAAQPWGAHLSERFGYRKTFLFASILSAVSTTVALSESLQSFS
ncbi:MAG: MFS transporter [Rhodospirillaceae bacterium]